MDNNAEWFSGGKEREYDYQDEHGEALKRVCFRGCSIISYLV